MLNIHTPSRTRGTLKKSLAAALAATTALLAAACSDDGGASGSDSPSPDSADPVKVALLYYGNGENDYDAIWRTGVTAALDKVYPDAYELQEITDVPFTDQMTQIIDQAFTQGADIVIEDIGGGELTNAGCVKHPDKVCIANYPQPLDDLPENMAGFSVNYWTQYYLQGVLAGSLTESNVLGYVSPFDVNFDTMFVNSLTLGCQSVNPDCVVKRTVINSYLDPAAARAAGKALVGEGADVLLGLQDDSTIVSTGAEEGVWAFGVYRPMEEYGPETYVNSWMLTPIVEEHVTNVLQRYSDGEDLGEALTVVGPYFDDFGPNVPDEAKEAFETAQQEIEDGKWIFDGPISDNKGELRVEEGDSLEQDYIYASWDWYVEGVEGAN